MPWCHKSELEPLGSEQEQSLERFRVLVFQVCTQAECSRAQELGFQVWGYSLEFPLAQESRPRLQVEVVLLLESQGLGPLGDSSLVSHWVTLSKHQSCQVAMDCLIPMGSHPMEWLVQGARLATQQGQGLDHRRQQQQLKQPSMVLEELESFLVLEELAFLVVLAQFLGLEALQVLGFLQQLLLQRLLLRLLSMELLEA